MEFETGIWRKDLIVYVVTTGLVEAKDLDFLPKRGRSRFANFVVLSSLPRTASGQVDHHRLPLPVIALSPGVGKGGELESGYVGHGCALGCGGPFIAVIAFFLTNFLWPYSTDLSLVPQPWASFFFGLYVFECLAFGLGVVFLITGHKLLARHRRPRWLTVLTRLAIAWLLIAWWPQDNFYRLAEKTDWPRQAALVYGFNITLMIAAVVVVVFVAARPVQEREATG